MKKLFFLLIALFLATGLKAEIPSGYYSSLNGLSQSTLKTAVYDIISNHTRVSSYSALPDYFRKTDVYPNGNQWWEMYSNKIFAFPEFTGLNREHCVPKSWWGGSTSTPAYTDLNHLYPSEQAANSAKSNYPLGEVLTSTFDNGVSRVGYAINGQGGGASKVFEPDDQYKGDFARAYFYVATCYQNLTWKYTYMFQNGTYPTFMPWAIELLLKWHRQDPVSQKETDRNEVVYSFQSNRNPFIDYPQLAEHIWGNKKDTPFYINNNDTPSGKPSLISPTHNSTLDFGIVGYGDTHTMKLLFKGSNLSTPVSLTIVGNNSSIWTLSDNQINNSLINSSGGYSLNITYTPSNIGSHTATLLINSYADSISQHITLNGQCQEVPTLSKPTALPATSITNESYTANWQSAPEDIDYYIVTRTRYVGGIAFREEIESDLNVLEITDFNPSYKETYSVQSVKMGYRSIMSNVITVEHGGITGVDAEHQLVAIAYPGWVRFICGNPHTNGVIYDISGRTIKQIPIIVNDMEITIPHGIYMLQTDQLRYPAKIIVR